MLFYTGTSAQSCKEGSVEHDHLGQRRTCRGGKWSAPCRVRREWNGMLPGERWVNVTVHLQCEKTPLFPWHLCYLLTCKWSPLPSHITSGIFSLVNIHEKKNLNIIATGRRHWSMMWLIKRKMNWSLEILLANWAFLYQKQYQNRVISLKRNCWYASVFPIVFIREPLKKTPKTICAIFHL